MLDKAKSLRKKQTDAEGLLWRYLRNRQIANSKFRRQHIIGSYIVDFICLEKALIVEVDGGQHLDNITYDEARTEYLNSKGYRVIRFWNNEVLSDMGTVLSVIHENLINSH